MYSNGIIYVDAYDSFSNNIIALLAQLTSVAVIKIDDEVADLEYLLANATAVVIGPGPGHPENPQDIGLIPRILNAASEKHIPLLGICLGFQTLCSSHGLPIDRLPVPCHGHPKEILHIDADIFHGVGIVSATCYNSLGVLVNALYPESRPGSSDSNSTDTSAADHITHPTSTKHIPSVLLPLAQDSDGYLMAVRHPFLPQWGLQFHPESCKSNLACHRILRNWWSSVSSWNGTKRPPPARLYNSIGFKSMLSQNQNSPFRAEMVLPTRRSLKILQYFFSLTNTAGPAVQSRRLSCPVSVAQIPSCFEELSDFCFNTSRCQSVVMLESTKNGRYSIYAMRSPSTFRIEYRQGVLSVENSSPTHIKMTASDCFHLVEQILHKRTASGGDNSLPFWGGFLGYISYEIGLDLLDVNGPAPASMPSFGLLWTERSIVVDHLENTTTIQSIRTDDTRWIEKTASWMMMGMPDGTANRKAEDKVEFQESLRRASYVPPNESDYKAKIGICLEQLRAGNSYELCLTTEAQVRIPASPSNSWQLYQNLRRCNPVPFAAYIKLGTTTIISSSPEQFLTWSRTGAIDMVPMKGTVRKTPSMTLARASTILASPKEQAENLMIADLCRHDLHAALGPYAAVSVPKLCAVEEHETVYQLVSHIHAEASPFSAVAENLRRGHRVLRHALPPGSMTGAPKKRSCEILSSLEKRERGMYSGVIGYFDVGGGGAWSVCIRSAFTNAEDDADGMQTWRVGAGGAITVLSEPQAEWEEMQTKLESVLRAFRPNGDEKVASA